MAAINCLRCGVSNRAGSNFCNNCGAKLPGATPPPAPDETDPPERDPTATGTEDPSRPEQSPPPPDEAPFQQPWLRSEADALDETVGSPQGTTPGDEPDERDRAERLITGVQGLLEPNAIAAPLADSDVREPAENVPPPVPGASPLDDAELRQLRRWLTTVPTQTQRVAREQPSDRRNTLFLPALFLLLGLGLALPILLPIGTPAGAAHAWPGVTESFALVSALPEEARVLTYWAYDPATAGEMDFVAHPVLTHLVGKRSQLLVASPLPGGPPLFLNLLEQVATETRIPFLDPLPVMIGYLPGGATVLPLLGQAVDRVLPAPGTLSEGASIDAASIDLALVVAARAEDVQAWLEQVQPRNGAPVLVVSSAGADPILRPYWQSGQIAGLVSGFDGGSTYWSLLANDVLVTSENTTDASSVEDSTETANADIIVPYAPLLRVRRWMVYQNWGHLIFILIIVLGNVAGFVQRRRGNGTMPAAPGAGDAGRVPAGSEDSRSSTGKASDG